MPPNSYLVQFPKNLRKTTLLVLDYPDSFLDYREHLSIIHEAVCEYKTCLDYEFMVAELTSARLYKSKNKSPTSNQNVEMWMLLTLTNFD